VVPGAELPELDAPGHGMDARLESHSLTRARGLDGHLIAVRRGRMFLRAMVRRQIEPEPLPDSGLLAH
jgi:hypothetical protein